jgi:hypothetical protein
MIVMIADKYKLTRRQSIKRVLGLAGATFAAPMFNHGWFQLFAQSATKYSARAIDLLQRSTTIDAQFFHSGWSARTNQRR